MSGTAANEIEIVVKVKDQATAAVAAIRDEIKTELAALGTAADVQVKLNVDADDLREKIRAAVDAAGGEDARIRLSVDAADLHEKIKAAVEKVGGTDARVKLDVDSADLHDKIHAAVGAAGAGTGVAVRLDVDAADLRDKIKVAVDSSGGSAVKIKLDVDADDLREKIKAALDVASAGLSIKVGIEIDAGDAAAKLAAVEVAARDAGAALDDAGRKADRAGQGASSGGSGFSLLSSKAGLLTQAALALGPALAAIPAILSAVAVGGATLALGLGGVVKALTDYGAQSAATGQSSAQLAATAFSNAVAIRNAEQSITDAKRQAAIQQQNSLDSVASAQEHLVQAQQGEQLATESLNQAWKDASNILKDLNNNAADAVNGVADAQIALKQAQLSTAAVVNSSLSTDDQKAAALQAVVDAQQHLADAQQKAVEAQGAADDANAKGVSGSTAVVAAQRAQATAAQGVVDAQHAVVVAQRNAAQQQQASAEAIQKAVQNLSDTYRQQQLAAAAAASSGSAAANQFQKDMAGLTGPGRIFVDQLLSMKTGAKELAATAQTSMLPGLTTMLRDSGPMLPVFNGAIREMGGVIGGLAIQFGKLMQSPAFQGQLTTVLHEGAMFAQQFGNGMVQMFAGVTKAAAAAGPIVAGLGIGFQILMGSGIPALFSGLTVNASGTGQALSGVLGIVSNLLGPIGTLSGSLAGALGPALQVLAQPAVAVAFQSIAQLLGVVLRLLTPFVTLLANGLVGALKIVTPLLQSLSKFLTDNHTAMSFVVGAVLAVVAALKAWAIIQGILNILLTANPIGLLIVAIAGLVIGLIYCWEHFKGFRDFIKAMLGDFHNWFFDIWHFIDGIWHGIASGLDWLWNQIVIGFGKIEGFFAGLPGNLAKYGLHLWDWVTKGLGDIGGVVAAVFKAAVDGIIDGVNWVSHQINGMSHAVSDIWSWAGAPAIGQIPDIPQWKAMGGVTGGLSAIIGERGIEMTRLPNGSVVMPHANTASAMAAGGMGGTGGGGTMQLEIVGTESELVAALLKVLRTQVRIIGGASANSVQKTLGQAF